MQFITRNVQVTHYVADIQEENGPSIHVCISSEKGSNGKYAASTSEFLYPIESVSNGGVEKDDISTWRDGDTIVLGIAVPES